MGIPNDRKGLTMRLFFALQLNEEARESADTMAYTAKASLSGKYTRKDDYHVTIAYVGEIDPSRLEELKEIGAQCAKTAPAAEITLSGSGLFKKNILYCGIKGGEIYKDLSETLKDRLDEARFPFDPKPYRAHVTIAHEIHPDEFPLPEPDEVTFPVKALTLFESTRVKNVLRYLPVAVFPLTGGKA